MHATTLLLAGLLALSTAARPAPPPPDTLDVPIGVTRVSPRVVVLDCLDVNVTAIATSGGIVVVDTGRSPGLVKAVMRRVERELGRADVRHVVNTHGHPDHASGNQVFRGAVVVAQRNAPEFMRHCRADAPATLWSLHARIDRDRARLSGAVADHAEARQLQKDVRVREWLARDLEDRYVLTPATLTFDDSLTLDLGDARIELYACGRAHTNNDVLVYVPAERLLLTGDLFCGPRSLCFAADPLADVPGISTRLERLLADPAGLATIVPGHGDLLTRADLVGLLGRMREDRAAFDGRRSAAATLDTLIAAVGPDSALVRFVRPLHVGADTAYFAEEELNTLAETYRDRGRLVEAVRILTRTLELLPHSALLWDTLGEIQWEMGDVPAAVSSFERSLAAAPTNRHAAEMLRLLHSRRAAAGG